MLLFTSRLSVLVVLCLLASLANTWGFTESSAEISVLTIRQAFRGIGEGFIYDQSYIAVEECLNDSTLEELKYVMRHTEKLSGLSRHLTNSFYMARLSMKMYSTCDMLPFVYDVLSLCFNHQCTVWTIALNSMMHIKELMIMSLQTISLMRRAMFIHTYSAAETIQIGHQAGLLIGSFVAVFLNFQVDLEGTNLTRQQHRGPHL